MDETALGVYTALFTGIRIGELCAMTWDYIDMEAETMRIGRTMQRIRSNTAGGRKTGVKIFEPKSVHSCFLQALSTFLFYNKQYIRYARSKLTFFL